MSDRLRAMQLACDQLRRLRRENEVLRARVDTMDTLAAFLGATAPSRGVGMEEDAAWLLDKVITEELEKRKPQAPMGYPPHPEPAPRPDPEEISF